MGMICAGQGTSNNGVPQNQTSSQSGPNTTLGLAPYNAWLQSVLGSQPGSSPNAGIGLPGYSPPPWQQMQQSGVTGTPPSIGSPQSSLGTLPPGLKQQLAGNMQDLRNTYPKPAYGGYGTASPTPTTVTGSSGGSWTPISQQGGLAPGYWGTNNSALTQLQANAGLIPQGSTIPFTSAAERQSGIAPVARGGAIGYASGGASDYFAHKSFGEIHAAGLIKSPVAGRTDHLPINVPSGSYVLPADHVSHLGQGNSLSGGKVLDHMFGLHPPATAHMHANIPRPPALNTHFARGGSVEGRPVPIIVAGGEYLLHPEHVRKADEIVNKLPPGTGDLKRGHDHLDKWVVEERKKHVKMLNKLPPPKA